MSSMVNTCIRDDDDDAAGTLRDGLFVGLLNRCTKTNVCTVVFQTKKTKISWEKHCSNFYRIRRAIESTAKNVTS